MRLLGNRVLFKAAYMAFLLVHIIPMVNHWAYTDIFLLLFMLWGYGLLVADVAKNRFDRFRRRAIIPLGIFYVLCGVSLLANPHNAFVNSALRLGIFFLCGAVLYIVPHEKDDLVREATAVARVYVAVTGIMAAVSVGMYLVQYQYQFIGPLGENIRIGVWENRLFGLFTSGNVGGSLMAVGLLLSLGLLHGAKAQGSLSLKTGVLPVAAGVFQLWHLSLTLSRGTVVALLAAGLVLGVLYPLWPHHRPLWAAVRQGLCLVLAVVVFFTAMNVFRWVSLKTVGMLSDNGLVDSTVTGFDRIEYEDSDENGEDISNKRFSIWKASWRLARGKWLVGTGRNYFEYLRIKDTAHWLTEDDHVYLTWSRGNTHNGYLQIAVDSGVPALVAFMVFLLWCGVNTLRAYSRSTRRQRRTLALCLAVVVYVLVNNLFESNMVLMSTNPIQAIFWFVAGVDLALSRHINEQ